MQNLVERLRADFTRKTLGELLQEREAAAREIERLERETERLRAPATSRSHAAQGSDTHATADRRVLLRLKDLSDLLGLSRSSIYSRLHEGTFPRPIRAGARAVRWRKADIEAWLAAREAT